MKNYALQKNTSSGNVKTSIPLPSQKTWQHSQDKIILLDNGAYEIKHSTSSVKSTIRKFQNAKFYEKLSNNDTAYYIEDISNDFPQENISNIGRNFARPLARGLMFDIDLQLDIWEQIFSNYYRPSSMESNMCENMLLYTHTPLSPDEIIEANFQLIFEYFNFNSCIKSVPHLFSSISALKNNDSINKTVQLVIDSGFSSTTIVPIFNKRPIYNAIRRLDIGGKLMSNYLKESLSNTIDLDVRKEFFLANLIKEESCFVSKNFNLDMKISSMKFEENKNKKIFVLPEYRNRSEEQLRKIPKEKWQIELNTLNFIVPELLFKPSIAGIEEPGIHEAIMQSVNACHSDYRQLLLENIIITGGNALLPNFKERLLAELQPLSIYPTSQSKVKVFSFENSSTKQGQDLSSIIKIDQPQNCVINGMKHFCKNLEELKDIAISKQDYEEIGFNVIWKNCL
jgi:actin-related protein 6